MLFLLRLFALAAVAVILGESCVFSADPPAFVVHAVRDERPNGEVVRLSVDGSVELARAMPIPGAEVIVLRRAGQPIPHLPHDRPHVLLANGDRIPGSPVEIEGERVRFAADLGAQREIALPLSSIAAVWLTPQAAARAAEPESRRAFDSPRRHDSIGLTNGDTLNGTLKGAEADGPYILARNGAATRIPRDRIEAVWFNTDLARASKPRGIWRRLVLQNGARLSLRSATIDAGELTGVHFTGAELRVPLGEIAALYTLGGSAIYLSDLTPRRYEPQPFLGVVWPLNADRSVVGRELRLDRGTFDKGLGLHSACLATYALPPHSRRFEALVGLDEETGRRGAATIQVHVDGRALLESAVEILGGGRTRELRLTIPSGGRELTIEVGFGRGGDVQDHVNWADARVIVGAP